MSSSNPDPKKHASQNKSTHSSSKALVSKAGASEVAKPTIKQSTQQALILRNGKYGAMGGGELVPHGRLSGREKMELLAEDDMRKKTELSLRAPFNLEKATKLAKIRFDCYIDDINRIHNPELCSGQLDFLLDAYIPANEDRKQNNPMENPEWIAQHFTAIVHNSYMLGAAWKIVYENFVNMEVAGLKDKLVRDQIRSNERIRQLFLLNLDMAKILLQMAQQNLRQIVSKTPHYAQFFCTSVDSDGDDPVIKFDLSNLRPMYKSFMDSIIVELCLPNSEFSAQALINCLHTIQIESFKDTKRCPQAMWDAIAVLSDAVELLDFLETPLLAMDDNSWKEEKPVPTKEVTQWWSAYDVSMSVLKKPTQLASLVYPLNKLSEKEALDKLWKGINAAYARVSGAQVDELWRLVKARQINPIWHLPASALDLEDTGAKSVVKHTGNKRVTIEEERNNGYDSMPELLSASESEDSGNETDTDFSDTESEEEKTDGPDDESTDDSEEDEEMRTMIKQAWEHVMSDPQLFGEDVKDSRVEERKENHFIKLLSNLRGRMFTSSPVLKTESGRQGERVPEPEREDEEAKAEKKKKKKKKPKKKKKKTTTAQDEDEEGDSEGEDDEPETAAPSSPTVTTSAKSTPGASKPSGPTQPVSPTKQKAKPKVPTSSSVPFDPFGSTTTLASTAETKAQSAHAYLQQNQANAPKVKVKSRPERATTGSQAKKGLFSKLTGSSKQGEEDRKPMKSSEVFASLKKRSKICMRRLFGVTAEEKKGGIKWQQFVQFMTDMGFQMENSVAGSRVTFTPNDPRLSSKPVTFHRPHPDSTLNRWKCRQYADTLKNMYGWHVDKLKPILLDSDEEFSS